MLLICKGEGLLGRALFLLDELVHNVKVLLNGIKSLRVARLPRPTHLSRLVMTMQVSNQVDIGWYSLRIKPAGTRISLSCGVP